jgi:hypothetical protein
MHARASIKNEYLPRKSKPIYETSVHTILLRKAQICIDNCPIEETIVGCPRFELEL